MWQLASPFPEVESETWQPSPQLHQDFQGSALQCGIARILARSFLRIDAEQAISELADAFEAFFTQSRHSGTGTAFHHDKSAPGSNSPPALVSQGEDKTAATHAGGHLSQDPVAFMGLRAAIHLKPMGVNAQANAGSTSNPRSRVIWA